MKLLRYGPKGQERSGMLDADGGIRCLAGVIGDIDPGVLGTGLAALAGVDVASLPRVDAGVRLAEPVARVGKFICIGLNYRDHAAESGQPVPTEPIIFTKAISAIIGPNDDVVLPPTSAKSDWEVELGVVIGKEARYVSVEDALDHVAGVCVVNDLSEREYQLERGGTWDKGKGCDTFGPFGPYLVTLDEAGDLNALGLWLDVNGERMQTGSTSELIFDVPFIVSYVSRFMSLQPGDIISTGTPPGVGMGKKPQRWLTEGDVITLGIDGLGEQRQAVRRYGA
ncbi:fumarylacetoacetate hydrolase family protein [Polymorphobacter sp. PAMC 29334]|uniref:fumarylacetoacetate hydrolase family protein n=1 Tax=Polymorphobacter sp. PAMC 29334 TaxID=2862331 RepID=UPI001C66F01C|nr:fumarylacetoacetate hydrolase family protein [Polymorphobacter sp. PAMC 29334]QYE34901.1 fumarylacetoacetate hydrolase family protein [Polymorphobacter sp. PAMC 29334]